jgi:diguanylate cyclase (GGDEF)-like protein
MPESSGNEAKDMSGPNLRVLLAEKVATGMAETLRKLYGQLERGLELTVTSSLEDLIPAIKLAGPDAVLLDLSLAQPGPLEVVRRVHREAPGVPLIVVAEAAEKATAAQCLSNGAMGYLLRGQLDARTLEQVLRNALECNTLKGLTDLLRDPITGLYIRDGLLTLGARSMDGIAEGGGTLILLCALIENLPALRTQFGRTAADNCISEASALLSEGFRRTDIIARVGEGQFAILAVDATEPSVAVLRQRVEERLRRRNQVRGNRAPLNFRISIGFWTTPDERTFAEFLDTVEAELRAAPVIADAASVPGDRATLQQ